MGDKWRKALPDKYFTILPDKLTQEFAQVKDRLTHKWLQYPGCHSHQTQRIEIQEISESLLECKRCCSVVWRCISDGGQQDYLLWRNILTGQVIVHHWTHRGR